MRTCGAFELGLILLAALGCEPSGSVGGRTSTGNVPAPNVQAAETPHPAERGGATGGPAASALRGRSTQLAEVKPAVAAGSKDGAEERQYAGLTLAEWRDRVKDLDPADPQSAQAVPGLLEIVRDSDAPWQSRRQAALTLGRIGRPAAEAVPCLEGLLDEADDGGDGQQAPRLWAAKGLALFGPLAQSAAPKLSAILHQADAPQSDRIAAIDALSRIGESHPAVVPALLRMVASGDATELRELAAEALGVIGPPAASSVPVLIRATRDGHEPLRRTAAAAIGAMGFRAEVAIPALGDLLAFDDSHAVRDRAAAALAQIGSPAVAMLTGLLADSDHEVRWRAAESLGRIGPPAQPACDALRRSLDDADARVRLTAAEALWSIAADAESVVPALIRGLTVNDRTLRLRAVQRLTSLGPSAKRAIEPLERLRSDERGYVRQAATKALAKIRSVQ